MHGLTTSASSASGRLRSLVAHAVHAGTAEAVAEALLGVEPDDVAHFFHATFHDDDEPLPVLTTGIPASPGAASGRAVFRAVDAMEAGDRGEAVILVRAETTPDDVLGMQSARGIVTCRGGLASHAAVVARGWGIPAVVGAAEIVLGDDEASAGGLTVRAGDVISLDGSTGEIFVGAREVLSSEAPEELDVVLRWADAVRAGRVRVRANADTGSDAAHARHLGAEGIGLCRTEHMFLSHERLPLMRRFILTDDPDVERATLAELEAVQQQDFESVLTAMNGLPVTVRLLDPPLHEFLPDSDHLVAKEARGELGADDAVLLVALRRLRESNPMIGTRGVRLGLVKPGVYHMQVRALTRAVAQLSGRGLDPRVEIMIPLVVDAAELALARRWVLEALEEVGGAALTSGAILIGAMIETPRAALLAGRLAEHADFFSFGTNDLTQLTFAFSRDDVEARLLPHYLGHGILQVNPFAVLDPDGVGRLVQLACTEARAAKPAIKLGVCGEHAGHPSSVAFLVAAGVDSVSCSPFRVPLARLAVAQALLRSGAVTVDEISDVLHPPAGSASGESDQHAAARSGDQVPGELDETLVLHVMRIRGFASGEALAESLRCHSDQVVRALHVLADVGLVRHIPARDLWQLTSDGTARHREVVASIIDEGARSTLRQWYPGFLTLNDRLKELCTRWQTRDGIPNDHADPGYDAACVEELQVLMADAGDPLTGFSGAVARFEGYEHRLASAASRVAAGETKLFTGVMCGSFHDVWMELHEDLVQLLAIDRTAEGSF